MFGKNKRVIVKQKPDVEVLTTEEIARSYAQSDNAAAHPVEHLNKLAEFTGITPAILLMRAKLLGLNLIVDCEFVEKFKYGAQIGERIKSVFFVSDFFVKLLPRERTVVYSGDIPDFALSKMSQLKECGFSMFTIHSNQPLPVSLVQLDPVIIAWTQPVGIYLEEDAFCSCQSGVKGVIVAMWDMDKEVTI